MNINTASDIVLAALRGGGDEAEAPAEEAPAEAEAPAEEAPAEAEEPAEEAPAEEMEEGSMEAVEVFSWWTGGGEAAGLEAMIEVFGEQYPDTEFINAAVAGGAGTNARAVLATRLQAGDAPGVLSSLL